MGLIDDDLSRLPNGVDSYPAVTTKAGGFAHFFDGYIDAIAHLLPKPIRTMLCDPPPMSSWVPEVYVVAACMALRDECFDSDDEFVDERTVASSSPVHFTAARFSCSGPHASRAVPRRRSRAAGHVPRRSARRRIAAPPQRCERIGRMRR